MRIESKRRSKVKTLQEAAALVKDGMMLGIGGGSPNAFMRELVRRGVKDLTIVPLNNTGYTSDILLGAGCARAIYVSAVMVGPKITSNFRRLAESGKLNVIEFDEMGLLRGLKASGAGVDFFPLPGGMLGCDNVRANPDFYKEIKDPFTGKTVVVVPPIRPDICVLHVGKCDAYGNGRETNWMEEISYQAANKVIVTTEEVVPIEDTIVHNKDVTILGPWVDVVVEVPYGAHPGGSEGYYEGDGEHLRIYQEATKEEASFKKYLDEYVYKPGNNEKYLEKLGVAKLLELKYGRRG